MHHIPRLSEAVYVGMCRYVGSPTEVRIRREVTDTEEKMGNSLYDMRGLLECIVEVAVKGSGYKHLT